MNFTNYVRFLLTLTLLFPAYAADPGAIDLLNSALAQIARTPRAHAPAQQPLAQQAAHTEIVRANSYGLLGPWMLQNEINKLIAHDTNFQGTGAAVYQIKVIRQWKEDCWIHSFRNGLYILDLVRSPREKEVFNQIYGNMVDREQYKKFTRDKSCPRLGYVTREFIQKQLDCRPACIPAQSLEYLSDVLTFFYEPSFDATVQETAAKTLRALGDSVTSEQLLDYALLKETPNFEQRVSASLDRPPKPLERLIDLLHNLRTKEYYSCAINFLSKNINHEIVFVINKQGHNNIEYLFADSNNMSFKGDNYSVQRGDVTHYYMMDQKEYLQMVATFASAIRQIVSWVQHPERFDDLMVRMFYAQAFEEFHHQKKYNIDLSGADNWKYLQQFAVKYLEFFHTLLQKHGLLNNKLYQTTYKKAYCDFIKKEQQEQHQSNHYKKLLNKVGC